MAHQRKDPLVSGPTKGVFSSDGPYDDDPSLLYDALNGYVPDTQGGSSWWSRPGFTLLNDGDKINAVSVAPDNRGQGTHVHVDLDGTVTNFIVIGGHLYRTDDALTVFEDVTPVGVTIDDSFDTRVAFCDLLGTMVVNDSVNRPWIASDLTSTPITGTYIDYDGAGVSWSAYGAPRVYGGSMFFILKEVNGIARRQDVSWSELGDPATGYQQVGFDNNWTLITNSSGALYALWPTNTAMYFFRLSSIGSFAGDVGPDLASTATEDSIGFNVGASTWATMTDFGSTIYFCDALGRPWSVNYGQPPRALWQQMQAFVAASSQGFPSVTSVVATAAQEPTLLLWIVAIWSPTAPSFAPPIQAFVYDVRTGTYVGRWKIKDGASIECLGTLQDGSGRTLLIALGSNELDGESGYGWSMNAITGAPIIMATQDLDPMAIQSGELMATEGQDAVWTDDGEVPEIEVTTNRLGYADSVTWNVDQGTVVTLSDAPCTVSLNTAAMATTVEGTPTPSASEDGTYRLVVGMEGQGRGPTVTISPTTADGPWSFQSVRLQGVPSQADPVDP